MSTQYGPAQPRFHRICPYPACGAAHLYLKSVEIVGFKSFARPTRLELPHGITALVGPNGSGKSNIVDAVRWCLGEQSIRDIRGNRAEDVIFAGTRRVMGFAEVQLSFDSDAQDSRPFSALSVARRTQRTGDTAYALNGERVRLRDVMSAVRSLGIDGNRYVVVNQGMADAWLLASPTERRQLLEHAAGLSGYRARREEARQKLATTAQNMALIETVLAELEPRLRILRRQARAVRERDEAAARLQSRLVQWYGCHWHASALETARLARDVAEAARERVNAEEALQEAVDAAEAWLQADREQQERLDAARASHYAAQRESDAARFHLERLTRERANAEAELAAGAAQTADNEAAIAHLEAQLREAEVARARTRAEAESWGERAAQLDAALTQVAERAEEARGAAARAGADRDAVERVLLRAADELERTRTAVERCSMDVSRIDGRASELAALVATLEAETGACMSEVLQAQAALETQANELSDAVRKEGVEAHRLQRLERLRVRLRSELGRLSRQHEVALRTRNELAHRADQSTLDGIRVPPGWERAAAVALGAWQTQIHEERWTSDQIASFRAWRASLGIARDVQMWGEAALQSRLSWPNPLISVVLVAEDAAAQELWQRVGPERGHTVDSPPLRIISRAGVIHAAPGAGEGPADDRGVRYLEAKHLTEVLARKLARATERLSTVTRTAEAQAARTAETAARCRTAQAARSAAQDRLEGTQGSLRERERALWQRRAELESLAEQQRRVAAEAATLAQRADHLRREVERLSEERSRAQAEASTRAGELAELTKEVESSRHEREGVSGQHRAALAALSASEQTLADVHRSLERFRAEQHAVAERRNSLESALNRLTAELADSSRRDASLSRVAQEHAARVTALEQDRQSSDRPVDQGQEARARLSAAVAQHERARAQHHRRAEELAALRSEILSELGDEPDRLPVPLGEPPADDEIRRLRLRANQYPDADESVVEELAEIESRYNHLRANLEDLSESTGGLDAIMRTADEEMRGRFTAAFDAVNAEFSRMFHLMLKGGEASLEQVDADGGVGIRARLPGKRTQASAAFSGGEKALIACSLLFAVLRTSPTPFVILDEVDAALDESNVDRYLAALRHVAMDTQTIVVTHNRATMAAADALYGVTMDDEGASRLLSLRLDQYEAAG